MRHHHRLAIVEPFKSTNLYHHKEKKQQRSPPPILTPSPPQFNGTESSYIEDYYLRQHHQHIKHFPFGKNNNLSKYDKKSERQYSTDNGKAVNNPDGFEKIDEAAVRYLHKKHFQFGSNTDEILTPTTTRTAADEMAEPIRRYSPPISINQNYHNHHLVDINGNDLIRTLSSAKTPVTSLHLHINNHHNHHKIVLSKDPEISSFTAYNKTTKHQQHYQKENEELISRTAVPTATTSSFKHITNGKNNDNNDILVVHPSPDRSFFAPTSMPNLSNESRIPSENADQIKAAARLPENKQRGHPKQSKTRRVNDEKPKPSKSTRQFSCKYCEKDYMSLGALKMHIRTHTLPCKCTICGKAFSRPWLLQGHIRTHTGERPFGCSYCGRAFADRSNLRAHIQTHTHAKKHECSYCSKTFSRASLLKKHEATDCLDNITRRET